MLNNDMVLFKRMMLIFRCFNLGDVATQMAVAKICILFSSKVDQDY